MTESAKSHIRWPSRAPRAGSAFAPGDVARAYNFPTIPAPSVNPIIAIIELGGGHSIQDIQTAFSSYGLPTPSIAEYSVDDAVSSPGGDADAEVMLDILVSAAAYSYCTGTPANIAMIYAPNTDAGFADAVTKATAIGASTVSISWGQAESGWSASARSTMSVRFAALVAAGGIVFAASGDNDYKDGTSTAQVDYPASDPNVIGCGGTTMSVAGGVLQETVWNDGQGTGSGGGYSKAFSVLSWQKPFVPGGRGRMVPDVAGNADPNTGYKIIVGGSWTVVGGTSAVAPLYAGLFAALHAGGVPFAGLQAKLYGNLAMFNDTVTGNNGLYKAAIGPDPCTGCGTPKGTTMLATLGGGVTPPPPQMVAVPYIIDMSWTVAKQTLLVAGLQIAPPTHTPATDVVSSQSPLAGTSVTVGSTVTVTLSTITPPPQPTQPTSLTIQGNSDGTLSVVGYTLVKN